jgi:hypothetical protein
VANDEPTNLRMGFGFVQARASGAPYVGPRPAGKVNWDLKNKECERKLRNLRKQLPSIGALVRKIMEARKTQGLPPCSAVELYHVVLCHRPRLAPPGYWSYALNTYGWFGPQQSK